MCNNSPDREPFDYETIMTPPITPSYTPVDWAFVRQILEDYGKELALAKVFIEKLDKSLFGNGRPGILDRIDERLSALEQDRILERGAKSQRSGDVANIIKIVGIVGGALGIWAHIAGLGVHVGR